MSEGKASTLNKQANKIEASDPLKALELLKKAAQNYPNTWTVKNYVINNIIRIAIINELWDDAIEGCNLAIKIRPEFKAYYSLEAEACRLDKAGKSIEATEIWYKRFTLDGEGSGTARIYGDKFFKLGANDKAWSLYNKAIILAAKEKQSPHSVRASMAKLLLSEEKPAQAVEQIFLGIEEAEKYAKNGAPKLLSSLLKRALKPLGIKNPDVIEELVTECKARGSKRAMEKLKSI